MKKIALLWILISAHVGGLAQIIYSGNETSKLLTAYTGSVANDSIFVFCSPNMASLSADGTGGTAPYTFIWYQYQANTHQYATSAYAAQANVLTSTIFNVPTGGYKVVITDAMGTVVGCDIAWVWNLNIAADAGTVPPGCAPFSLNGSVNDNGTNNFSYYNPPADQLIIGPTTTITVCFSGTHTWISDLGFYLFSPPSCGSQSVTLSPNPGSIGQGSICNSGNNFTNLCFTTMPAANLDVCTAATPLSGTYSSYGATPTNINWSGLYGCDASVGNWVVKVFDCIGGDVGILQNASITFSGMGTCGPTTITYNSGAISAAINDNSCTAASAASYTVPLSADTLPISVPNPLSYNWTANPPVPITNGTSLNPSVNPNPTVDTWFYLNISGTYGCNKTDSVFYDYTAPVTPTITATGPYCTNAPGDTLVATPPGGTWSGVGITDSITGVFSPGTAGAGIVTIIYTGGGCTSNDTLAITVDQAASLATVQNVVICDGQMHPGITFTPTPGASTVVWSNNQPSIGLASNGTGNIPSFLAANGTQSPVTATVTAVASNAGCTMGPVSFIITVNPVPIPNAGADTGFCAGSNVMLSGSGGGSYSWLPATNLNNSTIANPVASPAATTVYTLTVTNSLNCSASDMVTVTVNPLPLVDAGANQVICSGSAAQLNATGASSFTWTPASSLSNPAIPNPVATPTATTQYTVTGTDTSGCSKNDVVTIVVNSGVTVTAGSDVSVCSGGMALLSATTSATSYTWSPGAGVTNINALSTTASPTVTTSYVITASASNGCTGKDTMVVTVLSLPPAFAGNDTGFCVGSSVQLNASGGIAYTWTPSAGLSATNVSNPTASPSGTTQYIVTVTDTNNCSKRDTVLVSVNPIPNVDAGAFQRICPGGSAQLSASGAVNYTWTPVTGLSNPNVSNPNASPSTATVYSVTGTDANGCSKTDTVSVWVGTPMVVTSGPNQTICAGDTITLTATSAATSYTWSPAAGIVSPNAATTLASPSVTTTYTVTADTAGACPGTAAVTITVNAAPVINAPATVTVCAGSAITITSSGALTYTWQPSAGLSNPNSSSPVFNGTITTTYTLSGSNSNGCSDEAIINVVVFGRPVIDTLIAAPTNCGSTTGMIQVGAVTGSTPFLYSVNGGSPQSSNQFNALGAGNYNVTVTDANGCATSQSIVVGSVNNVQAAFNASPTTGTYPLSVTFTNTSGGANNYNWTFGNGATSVAADPATTYTAIGTYTVVLIAYNNVVTCSDTAVVTIQVTDQPKITVPNIITPNGDGINDEFFLAGYGIATYQASFYDRWGKKVGEVSGGATSKWSPGDLSDGTYYYVLTATTIDGKTAEYHGPLTIIR